MSIMNSVARFGPRVLRRFPYICCIVLRRMCDCSFDGDKMTNGFGFVEEPLMKVWQSSDIDESCEDEYGRGRDGQGHFRGTRSLLESARIDAPRVLDVLYQDGPGFDTRTALNELGVYVSGVLVREVLMAILKNFGCLNKSRRAKLGYKFFVWSGEQENYMHSVSSYHLIMKIFSECEEFKAMWRLVDEMMEKGFPTTARTFNLLICTCGEAGLERIVVERFLKSKTFNYRPFKSSYNAILYSLLKLNQHKLIEWVYQQMLAEGYYPDILTYNVVMCAKYRLGKLDQFHRLIDEMGKSGLAPDAHTYNILLHVLGKGDKPLAAVNLMNHMNEVGISPNVLHFTTLIDGLSRARNMDACQYFFNKMIKIGCLPDVICYTVLITGYIAAGALDRAQELFDEMTIKGLVPNVFTYNAMIRGFCVAERFNEACLMLKEMESRGRNPNFFVYSTLVNHLQTARKHSKAQKVIKHMVEKGHYAHLISKLKRYRRL